VLGEALHGWPGTYYWSRENGVERLVLIRVLSKAPRERWWLHAGLFLVTFLTVAAGGALLAGGVAPLREVPSLSLSWESLAAVVSGWAGAVRPGLNFAMALMAILLVHECGHYFLAQRYLINASPPYFLPAPYQINFIGTFGAFIRLRSPVADRRQLMDVGAAGPWAGFIVALFFLVFGLLHSQPTTDPGGFSAFIPALGLDQRGLGDSLVTLGLRHWFFGDAPVLLHPLALAGWFGVLVTGLNLLPLGQLDGGHVLYALVGQLQGVFGVIMWLALFPLGHWFFGWYIWAILILILSRGRVVHPSVVDRHRSIPLSRKILGWATVILFAVTFTPVPLYVSL
jgi:membrane-associated protease RseP (regulator of RpoE activity)